MAIDEHSTGEDGLISAGVPIRERYGLVLVLILGGYLLAGIDNNKWVAILNAVLWMAILLTALWSPGVPERIRRVGGIATLVLLISTVSLGWLSSDAAAGVRLLLFAIAQMAALLAILNQISRHQRVALQTVMGAIACYALIALAMAALFHGLEYLSGSTFLNGVVATGDYVYFSFVTLTTVGYGDITAASDVAKRLVVVEAFVGQVFLITLVARIVTLWGLPLKRSG
jgi:voltage-gated potassium channel Kch